MLRNKFVLLLLILVLANTKPFFKKNKSRRRTNRISETRIKSDASNTNSTTPFQVLYWNAKVDNFDYNNKDTFSQRILYSDVHYKDGGPIFFYTGNEGPIEQIWSTSNYMTDYLAPEYNALLIFVEHRYFGKSIPYNLTFSNNPGQNRYLSSEQALFDYARYLQEFKQNNTQFQNATIIAFGTSYGGMLSAWARIKYPHVFKGAVANSAPLLLFEGPRSVQYRYFGMVTKAFRRYSNKTVDFIQSANHLIDKIRLNPTPESIANLSKILNSSCTPIQTVEDIGNYQIQIPLFFEGAAQSNYPPSYPAQQFTSEIESFLESAGDLTGDTKILETFNSLFYNLNEGCIDSSGTVYQPDSLFPWWYMTCTEMVFPQATNGVSDMFGYFPWDKEIYTEQCVQYWNADVRPQQEFNYYGGRNYLKDLNTTSNIIFTNGDYDPWNAGCPQRSENPDITVTFSISAHGEALWVLPEQNPTVWDVREQIKQSITKWLN